MVERLLGFEIPVGDWVEAGVDWVQDNLTGVLDGISEGLGLVIDAFEDGLLAPIVDEVGPLGVVLIGERNGATDRFDDDDAPFVAPSRALGQTSAAREAAVDQFVDEPSRFDPQRDHPLPNVRSRRVVWHVKPQRCRRHAHPLLRRQAGREERPAGQPRVDRGGHDGVVQHVLPEGLERLDRGYVTRCAASLLLPGAGEQEDGRARLDCDRRDRRRLLRA